MQPVLRLHISDFLYGYLRFRLILFITGHALLPINLSMAINFLHHPLSYSNVPSRFSNILLYAFSFSLIIVLLDEQNRLISSRLLSFVSKKNA
jgi:hypothetical protein